MGADMIVLDEAGFIGEKAFMDYISPMLSKGTTAIVGISSPPDDPANWYAEAIARGKFNTYVFELVCAACKSRSGGAELCRHKMSEVPPYTSEARLRWITEAMGPEHAARMNRELRGVMESEGGGPEVFSADKVREFIAAPRTRIEREIRQIFVFVDPCNGSGSSLRTSDYAIVSIAQQEDRVVLMGIDLIAVRSDVDVDALLLAHVTKLRATPHAQSATIVLAVENLTGLEHDRVANLFLSRLVNVVVMRGEIKRGVPTTNAIKRAMLTKLDELLRRDRVVVADRLVSADPTRCLAELRAQLLRYREFRREAKTPHQVPQVVYSGKGPNNDQRDDAAVSLQLAIYWMHAFRTDIRYRNYW
jgi:hypothetical protein